MVPKLDEDEIDDLLYFARVGDASEFEILSKRLCTRETCSLPELLSVARDPDSGNGVLHMLSANNHSEFLKTTTKGWSQSSEILKLLNEQNAAGNTALHWAALNGHLECVKVLLEQGGDPTITNQRGHDAVYEAEINDRSEVVEWVLKEGGEGLEAGLGGDGGEREGDGDEDEDKDEQEEVDGKGLQEQLVDEVKKLDLEEQDKK